MLEKEGLGRSIIHDVTLFVSFSGIAPFGHIMKSYETLL